MADLKFSGLSEMGAADNSYLLPVSDDTTASEKKTFTPPLIDLFNNTEVAHASIATLTFADLGKTITLSGASFTLTLMSAGGVAGRIIDFLPDAGAAGTYTLDGSGSEIIGGSTTIDIINGDFLRIRSDGANWQIIVNVGSNAGVVPTSGTFPPTILDDSLSPSEGQGYTVQVGFWQRVGDTINFNLTILVNSFGTLTTSDGAKIGGLPVVSDNTTNNISAVSIGFGLDLNIAAGIAVTGYVDRGDSHITLQLWDDASGVTPMTLNEFSNNGRLQVSGQYRV